MIAIGPLLVLLALLGAPLFAVIAASAMWGFTREGFPEAQRLFRRRNPSPNP